MRLRGSAAWAALQPALLLLLALPLRLRLRRARGAEGGRLEPRPAPEGGAAQTAQIQAQGGEEGRWARLELLPLTLRRQRVGLALA